LRDVVTDSNSGPVHAPMPIPVLAVNPPFSARPCFFPLSFLCLLDLDDPSEGHIVVSTGAFLPRGIRFLFPQRASPSRPPHDSSFPPIQRVGKLRLFFCHNTFYFTGPFRPWLQVTSTIKISSLAPADAVRNRTLPSAFFCVSLSFTPRPPVPVP